MEGTLFCGNCEPALDQILAEPIVQMMMRRDGIDEGNIRELMRKATCARPGGSPRLDFRVVTPPERVLRDPPQASIGVLAQAAAEPRWPRVFPSL
jgi:hypothetical protein